MDMDMDMDIDMDARGRKVAKQSKATTQHRPTT